MKQITIITNNRVGVLADISATLANRGININEIDAEWFDEHGVIQLTTDHCDRALQVLRDAGFRAVTDDALVIRLKDEPGALARIAERFKLRAVNIRSIHIIRRDKGYSTVALTTAERKQAQELLGDVLIV